jgi:hypothetical protein
MRVARWWPGRLAFGILGATFAASLTAASAQTAALSAHAARITTVPEKLDKACRKGRARLYDECSDQLGLLARARKLAAEEHKVVLVSYGAEWCIWCHVFDRYIHGERSRFQYAFGSPRAPDERQTATLYEREKGDVSADAAALKDYVARSFVVVHVDGQFAPNGDAVLARTGAAAFLPDGIPFIFTLDANGRYAARFEDSVAEIRRDTADWYRGYDRRKLLAELQRLHAAAAK